MIRPPFFYGWLIVAAAGLLAFLGTGLFSYTRGVFLPALADTFGGRFDVALGFSIEMVVTALFAPFLGRFLDTYSPRVIIAIGILTVAVGYFLVSQVQALWQFYLVMGVCFGLGMGAMGVLPWQKVVVTWFVRRRGLALALGVMGASLAGIFMPPVASVLVAEWGWRGGFGAYGTALLLVLLPVTWLLIRNRPEDVGEIVDGRRNDTAGEPAGSPVAAAPQATGWLLRQPTFWAIAAIFSVMLCVLGVVLLHLYGHLLDVGLTEGQAALTLSVMAVAAALGKPVIGWLSDYSGLRPAIWLSLVVQAVALLTLAMAQQPVPAMVAAGLFGFGYSGVGSLQSLAVSVAFGSASFGRVRGLMSPFMLPVTVSASPLAGFVHDITGSYSLAFLVLGGVLVVAAAGPFFLPQRPPEALA